MTHQKDSVGLIGLGNMGQGMALSLARGGFDVIGYDANLKAIAALEKEGIKGFQPRWKALFPNARQVVIAKGNHYPMCDDPDLVANSIRAWYRDLVVPTIPRQ